MAPQNMSKEGDVGYVIAMILVATCVSLVSWLLSWFIVSRCQICLGCIVGTCPMSPVYHLSQHIREAQGDMKKRAIKIEALVRVVTAPGVPFEGQAECPICLDAFDEKSGEKHKLKRAAKGNLEKQPARKQPGTFSETSSYMTMLGRVLRFIDRIRAGWREVAEISSDRSEPRDSSENYGRNTVVLRACDHVFHKACLMVWIDQGNQVCPVCWKKYH